jgi:hypothetical protein
MLWGASAAWRQTMKRTPVATKTEASDQPLVRSASSEESELVQRIVATPAFSRSPLLTRFLLYVCDRKAGGRDEEITEHQIGVHALGRPESYSPGEDNIVRNYARILRKRLEEYFAGDGCHEPLRIVIPRGTYVPVFTPNTTAPTQEAGAEGDVLPAPVISAAPKSWLRLGVAAIATAVVLIAVAVYLGMQARAPRVYDVFWREILESGRPVYLVTGDSGFVMLQDITGTEVHLNDYISGELEKKFPDFHLDSTRREGNYGVDRFSNYTSTADLSIAVGVAARAQHYGRPIKVQYARDMHMEDLKSSNVILVGGPHANPWLELFEPESNFRMEIPLRRLEGMHADQRLFINKHPRAREQAVYANQAGNESHLTYALVSFLPSADGAGHVVLLEGENMAGTRAAGDFLLDARGMQPILNKAQLGDGEIGPFEVLLEARTVGANAPKARVVVERFGVSKSGALSRQVFGPADVCAMRAVRPARTSR